MPFLKGAMSAGAGMPNKATWAFTAVPAHRIEDDDGKAVRDRDSDALGDVAERIPEDFAAADQRQLFILGFAAVRHRSALAVMVVVHRIDQFLPNERSASSVATGSLYS